MAKKRKAVDHIKVMTLFTREIITIQYNTVFNSPRGAFQNYFTICKYNTTRTNDIRVLEI